MTCEKCSAELTLEMERDQAACVECQKRSAMLQTLSSAINEALIALNKGQDLEALHILQNARSFYLWETKANSGEKPLFDEV